MFISFAFPTSFVLIVRALHTRLEQIKQVFQRSQTKPNIYVQEFTCRQTANAVLPLQFSQRNHSIVVPKA